jgi:uncharacterized protein YndB with AHSA1/START domain
MKKITVSTTVNAPIEKVWEYWIQPEHITQWYHASDDWHAPHVENDLKVDGRFKTNMAAKDGSASFDFEGIYSNIDQNKFIEYNMADGRNVKIYFETLPEGIKLTETFDPENINSEELQRTGWQAILDNFKKYAESKNN